MRKKPRNIINILCLFFFFILCFEIPPVNTATTINDFTEKFFYSYDFGLGDDEILGVVIRDDDTILVTGYMYNGSVKNLIVSRYLETGLIDSDFNGDGHFTLSLGDGDSSGTAIALQTGGKIIVAGYGEEAGESKITILRLTENGYLDTSFGSDGLTEFSISEGDVQGVSLAIGADDGIYTAGRSVDSSGQSYSCLYKLDSTGEMASDFGEDGTVSLSEKTDLSLYGVVTDDSGNILIAGTQDTSARLYKIRSDGNFETDFGEDGTLSFQIDSDSTVIRDLHFADNGNLYITGDSSGEKTRMFLAQIDSAALESGTINSLKYYQPSAEASGYAIITDKSNRTWITGHQEEDGQNAILTAYLEDSTLYSSGIVTTGDTDSQGYDIAVLSSGDIIIVGSVSNGTNRDYSLLGLTATVSDDATSSTSTETSSASGDTTFTISTLSVTDVTRTTASAGGKISETGSSNDTSCSDSCTEDCEDSEDDTCYEDCLSSCDDTSVSVSQSGVCYGDIPSPSYVETDESEEEDSEDDTSGDTDTTTDEDNEEEGENTSMNLAVFPDKQTTSYSTIETVCTDDGSTTGEYTSNLDELIPGVQYYIRAYALLSDDTLIYGNQETFTTEDACFIATAAFGSILDSRVVLLREFRDTVLLQSEAGKHFVSLYYQFSPPLASLIDKNEILKFIVRVSLLPCIGFAYLMLHITSTVQILWLLVLTVAVVTIYKKRWITL